MNKFTKLFNENMSDIESSNVLFKVAKKVSDEEKKELLEAFKENSIKISKRIEREYGRLVMTNSSI